MKWKGFCLLIFLITLLFSCGKKSDLNESIVVIETDLGDIKIKLYDETPKHRDNFIKLAEEKFYDGMLFHRVIKNMIVQGGDPISKTADKFRPIGGGGPGYKLPAEIVYPKYYHKRGAVAAARQADRFNPDKESSGSQFYIVQGTILDTADLERIAVLKNDLARSKIFHRVVPEFKDSMDFLMYSGMPEKLKELQDTIMAMVDREFLNTHKIFTFNEAQIKDYTSIGGAPALDGDYTVFGEVIEGMNVVDSIANIPTSGLDRPITDIKFKVKIIN